MSMTQLETVNLGPTPAEEPCAQVGEMGYELKALEEGRRYIALIRSTLGPEPEGAKLRVRAFQYENGTCHDVVCEYDATNKQATAYAYLCEEKAPSKWA